MQETEHDETTDSWLDHLAMVVVTLAAIAVLGVTVAAGMVMVMGASWSTASDVTLYFTLVVGTPATLFLLFRYLRGRRQV